MDDMREHFRSGRRDYTGQIVRTELKPQAAPAQERPYKKSKKRRGLKKRLAYLLIFLLIIAAGTGSYLYIKSKNASPVPKTIQNSVSFHIYYPDQEKLPPGYSLNPNSFHSSSQVVIYQLNYPDGKMVFTVQLKPSEQQLKNFYDQQIPLHTDIQTPVGTATIGAAGGQTIVSLPSYTSSWLIITAPKNIDQNQLKQVLQSIRP